MTLKRIPPSPAQSSDGQLPQSFDSGIYQSYPIMSEDMGQSMQYGSPPQYYQHPGSFSNMPSHSMMMSDPVMTPPPTGDEGSPFMESPSLSSSGSPPQRVPAYRARVNGTPRVKRKQVRRQKNRKDSDIGFKLDGPISQLTESFHTTPIRDMVAWVNRSTEERHQEVRNKNGKISRPMNAYMLYRSAYTARTKLLVGANNHQIVSKVTGLGWHMEPAEIRRKYNELARIERDNHAATHPDYKFAPLKNGAANRRDSALSSAMPSHLTDESGFSDLDSDFGGSICAPRPLYSSHSRSNSFGDSYYPASRGSSPFDGPDMMIPNYIQPNSHWSNTSHPASMSTMHPSSLPTVSKVEDISFGPVSPPQDVSYESALAGLPGASHHELLQPQSQIAMMSGLPHDMDPRLLSQSSDADSTMATYAPSSSSYSAWDEPAQSFYPLTSSPSMAGTPAPYSQGVDSYLPSMQMEGRDQSWDLARSGHTIPEPTAGEYELWCTTEPSQY
ncbi:unnamed protein product [Penicillium salamii]|uniref:HMG box domain-containing protein n=1 Tax=Penicillium salamii TaxID=1612424 RepID=A0A9W4IG56_9EURO|nr:unnamed protein product [Penicillium salamii]CAG8201458.1 unnamed protein product [Penicillium salamii]CAG8215866.1 unnamed protein product [Penicillium salamii]CAG8233085.1 unnamed protein product [Penicillium salamii]CAG8256167.1 unnamed protein product [Penicillium salamii]